jgi:hypothetical protein
MQALGYLVAGAHRYRLACYYVPMEADDFNEEIGLASITYEATSHTRR